jgi:hypothetical protein
MYSVPEVKRQSYYYSMMNVVSTNELYEPFRDDLMRILILLTDENMIETSRDYFIKLKNKQNPQDKQDKQNTQNTHNDNQENFNKLKIIQQLNAIFHNIEI